MDSSSVSIVVPAYNCYKTIKQTIESLLGQTFGQCEIVVVDDGSTDGTAGVIKIFPQVKYVYQENGGPAKARNRGVKESRGEIVFFTDSDCIAHSDWIAKAVKHFDEDEVAAVCGSYGIVNEESLLARAVYQEILYRHKNLVPDYPKVFGSFNVGIRKKIFDQVKGFEESYRYASGEDNDLSYKIVKAGYKIYFEKNALVDHYHPSSFRKYLKEQFRHGFWRAKMYRKHPEMTKGDGYTFWKDIVEIPLAFMFVLSFLITLTVPAAFLFVMIISGCLAFIELFYGQLVAKTFLDGLYLSLVMFLRAFWRFFGFMWGVWYCINNP